MNLSPAEARKWEFLRTAPQNDAHDPKLRAVATAFKAASLGNARWFALLAHCLVRDCVAYETDIDRTGHEDIAGLTRAPGPDDAVDALERGIDDCDAKARLFVALCLCAGLEAEMVGYEKDGDLVHVAARVKLGGQWLNVETTLVRARLGEGFPHVPKEANGKWAENISKP
jgi:transglutaminase-like putative cysteine protease